jgi:hypothetical protein
MVYVHYRALAPAGGFCSPLPATSEETMNYDIAGDQFLAPHVDKYELREGR